MNSSTRTTSAAVFVALGLAAAGNGLCAEKPMKQPTTSNTPNPAGQRTYFQLADPKVAVEDELMTNAK